MNFRILLLMNLILLVSCNQVSKNKFGSNDFPLKINLNTELVELKDSLSIIDPIEIFVIQDSVLVLNEYKGNNLLGFWNVITGDEITHFANKGRGPLEFMAPISCHFEEETNNVGIYDRSRMLYSEFDYCLPDMFNKRTKRGGIPSEFSDVIKYSDSIFIGTGMFTDGRFGFFNPKTKVLKTIGEYPELLIANDLTEGQKFMFFQGPFCMNKEKGMLVASGSGSGIIEFLKFDDDTLRLVKKYETLGKNDIKIKNKSDGRVLKVNLDPISMTGIRSVCGTKNYIYALLGGQSIIDSRRSGNVGNIIMCFDWFGNPVKYFKLDRNVNIFCVTKDDAKFYAIVVTKGIPNLITARLN